MMIIKRWRVVIVTEISNGKVYQIVKGMGAFSLANLGCRVQERTQMTFQKT
jgi:hypothetical protein